MSITRALRWAAVALAGVAAGALATRPIVAAVMDHTAVRNGPWRTSLGAGSAEANPYERAAVAIAGLYALGQEETLYYTAFTDGAGAPLDGACEYTLRGRAPPARWWSLTLYGADHYLVDNAAGIYSRHAGNLALDGDGTFAVPVSASAQARNWLPAPAAGRFSVTLRLYSPGPAVYANLATIALPDIVRGGCR